MADLIKTIENLGIVPVIVINNAERAEGLAKALLDGGIPCAEVTFRTAAAEEAIKRINKAYPQMLLGAGTVVSTEQAQRAVDAGAKFLVSPGYDQVLVDWCAEKNIPYFPGVSTASEVQVAVAHGFKNLKFFPAEACGGVSMIKNLCGPFPQVRFMTTGGISPSNLAQYAASDKVLAIGGSWMAKADMIENQEWDKITALCKEAVRAIHGFQFVHMGINADSECHADDVAKEFSTFAMKPNKGNSSTFMDTQIEIVNCNGRGLKGHICYGTYNVERALAYLEQFGFKPVEETIKKNSKGKIEIVYLDKEICGFAVHLKLVV